MSAQAATDAPPFFEPFACYREAVKGMRRRNRKYLAALLSGNRAEAEEHRTMRDFYRARAREWHDMIDWSEQ